MRQSTLARHLTWISRSDRPHRVVYCVASARTHETHQLPRSRSRHQHHRLIHRPDRTDALTTRDLACGMRRFTPISPHLAHEPISPHNSLATQRAPHKVRTHSLATAPHTLSCSPPHSRHAPTLVALPATRNVQLQSTTTPTRTRRVISLHRSPCRRQSAAAAPWFRIVCTVADQPMRSLYRRTAADQLSPHAQLMCRHSALHLNRERQRVSRAALIRKCVRTPAHGIDVPEQPITMPNSHCTCTLGEARP